MTTLLVTFTFWLSYGFKFTFSGYKSVPLPDCGIGFSDIYIYIDLLVDGTKTGYFVHVKGKIVLS